MFVVLLEMLKGDYLKKGDKMLKERLCPYCGKAIEWNAVYCEFCGNLILEESSTDSVENEQKEKNQ